MHTLRAALDSCRYNGQKKGHYESWFLRANHPSRPQAFWIRHTIFSPQGRPGEAIGELWAMFFDGEKQQVVAAKQEWPIALCRFSANGLDVSLPTAALGPDHLKGGVSSRGRVLEWDLRYASSHRPVKLLPDALYEGPFPKAKALSATPFACFNGQFSVDGTPVAIDGWIGSGNHNWGSKHTDEYAWGQVAGFDGAPDVFLECATARLKFGPVWTPRFSTVVLRVGERDYALNTLGQALKAQGRYGYFHWQLDSMNERLRIRVSMEAPASAFVGLNYYNPPGGSHTCLNSKIAACRVVLQERGHPERVFETSHRAAFEILTDDTRHGIAVVA